MLKQSKQAYILDKFHKLHTEATSSGLWKNVKLHKLKCLLTKDGAT